MFTWSYPLGTWCSQEDHLDRRSKRTGMGQGQMFGEFIESSDWPSDIVSNMLTSNLVNNSVFGIAPNADISRYRLHDICRFSTPKWDHNVGKTQDSMLSVAKKKKKMYEKWWDLAHFGSFLKNFFISPLLVGSTFSIWKTSSKVNF